jgi:hypothetical protein
VNSNRESLLPELRDLFTLIVGKSDETLEALTRHGGHVEEGLIGLLAELRDTAARIISIPPLAEPLIQSRAPDRQIDRELRRLVDELVLSCAALLVPCRVVRDEYAGTSWSRPLVDFENALARLAAWKAN